MDEENIKTITIPEELADYEIGDVVHVDFGGYKGFIKIEEFDIYSNNCDMCVFSHYRCCALHYRFCEASKDKHNVVFKPLGK